MRYLLLFCLLALGLTASSQIPDYVPSDGLVAWYGFANSGLEGTGNAPEMLLVGNATFTTDRSGIENNALDPNGGSANTDGPFFDYGWGDAFSLSMWFTRPINTGGNARLISTECPEGNFRIANDAVGQGIIAQMGTYMYLNPLSDAWHQVVYTYDGDATKRVYLDGALYAEEVETDFEPQNFCNPLALGRKASSSGSDLWPGDIDDLGIWDICLGEEEILGLYLSEVVVYGCTNEEACNYSPEANVNDGSCNYPPFGLTDCEAGGALCGEGTAWDEVSQSCVVANVSDTDFDGCVGINDFLIHLSNFGSGCGPELAWSCGDLLDYQGYDYETVQIGEQCWFTKNLRSENYENGDVIPAGLDNVGWDMSPPSGAVAVYGEGISACDPTTSPAGDVCDESWSLSEYGRLYNWHAVEDARGLCPDGWHVPTDGEWTVMTDHLGGDSVAGHQMKTTYGWWGGGNGTNLSGFSGLPGGFRGSNGSFIEAGVYGIWWSSSAGSNASAWYRSIDSSFEEVFRSDGNRGAGFSVRCIKDSE